MLVNICHGLKSISFCYLHVFVDQKSYKDDCSIQWSETRRNPFIPKDVTKHSSFDMVVFNTSKFCISFFWVCLARSVAKYYHIKDTGVGEKAHGNTVKNCAFQPNNPSTIACHHIKPLVYGWGLCNVIHPWNLQDVSTSDITDETIYLKEWWHTSTYNGIQNLLFCNRQHQINLTRLDHNQDKPPVVVIYIWHRFWHLHYSNIINVSGIWEICPDVTSKHKY